ncbi:hypothetical protein QLQ12_26715 [Actinoplanes sp. NEAU-A12]|uniref:Uncharacterized protein n=1 Tax=Actinoplanes sandaracinus TaxID=3045177 RepID=A0ABT6WRF2_9ACTN|nr:hypothetical protein [Actinoplanes sandaracinus]MDI6102215.1 hypothetical protein [Actinoplanes sandaracinus]
MKVVASAGCSSGRFDTRGTDNEEGFGGHRGSGLHGYQHAYGYRANLSLDSAAIGGNWNNRIRSARVC